MKKVNIRDIPEESWSSPKGRFAMVDRNISIALGREPASQDLLKRHPFDVSICRVPAGKAACPYHSHSAQWEFYVVISGRGSVRHAEGTTPVEAGDAFYFEPGKSHQISSDAEGDLVFYVIADNPIGECCHYPDSGKWLVRSPERKLIRSEGLEYLDGEE